jgi:hypothetical protein
MSDFKVQAIASLRQMTIDQLADYTASQPPGHWTHSAGMAEFTRRQTQAQLDACQAQIAAANAEERAANAAVETAQHAQRNAKYMLWSVIAAAASALISLISTLYTLAH